MAETTQEDLLISIARGMFSTRLHMLRLTEVVRLKITPDKDGVLRLPDELDEQMKQQAFDFLLATFPIDWHGKLEKQRDAWTRVQ
jgi:hypothetical protein